MTTTPTSPPGFRDGIEAAAKALDTQAARLREVMDLADCGGFDLVSVIFKACAKSADDAAKEIRALPTPDTLPTGWNSDMGEAPSDMAAIKARVRRMLYFVDGAPQFSPCLTETADIVALLLDHDRLTTPPPPGE